MNNVTKEQHETSLPLNAFLFVDKLPETQSLEIQNTNKDIPIQLKVDSTTDYWAVGATIFLSVFASIVAAWITVKLVSNSNTALINSQNNHQNKLLEQQNIQHQNSLKAQKEHQQREVLAKNRQEWINEVRKLIAEVVSDSQNFLVCVYKENAIRKINHKKIININDDNKITPAPFPESVAILQKLDFNITYLDLLLSKDNEIDREIYTNLTNIHNAFHKIVDAHFTHGIEFPDDALQAMIDPHLRFYHSNNKNLIKKTKDLLKAEWKRVKELT